MSSTTTTTAGREYTGREEAAIATIKAIEEAVREAGPAGIPSGRLYAALTGAMSLETYNMSVRLFKGAGLIAEENFVLTWTGE